MQRFAGIRSFAVLSTPKHAKPVDPAYFTGNSKYYGYLLQLNRLMRANSVENTPPKVDPRVRWMTRAEMFTVLNLRLTSVNHQDIMDRLYRLLPVDSTPLLTQALRPKLCYPSFCRQESL